MTEVDNDCEGIDIVDRESAKCTIYPCIILRIDVANGAVRDGKVDDNEGGISDPESAK